MTVTHGLTIKYGGSTYSVSGFDTKEKCADTMANLLAESGYTRPKPWEFWRWTEHRPSKILSEALERRGIK